MGLAARSVLILLESYVDKRSHSTVDHVTVGSVCRSIVEMQVFLGYLLEDGVGEDEWQLRKWTLDIHDCNSRLRLFRSLGDQLQVDGFKKELRQLQDRMRTNSLFAGLPAETQTEILVGRRLYVRGMRAALVAAGWDQGQWDGFYTYLSGSTHSAPISFYRSDDRGADNLSIVPHQFAFCGFALEQAGRAIIWANDRVTDVYVDLPDVSRPESS